MSAYPDYYFIQSAVIPYRKRNGKFEILTITSRRSRRWIVPKGVVEAGFSAADSAAKEAWEEAGVVGKAYDRCLGLYSYTKVIAPKAGLPCVAMVYPVAVKSLQSDYPEAGERRRKWFSQKKAAQMLQEPELARIVRDFDPKMLR